MSVTITVDLGRATPLEISQAAKFMLLFAGFDEQTGMLSQSQAAAIVGAAHSPQSPFAAGVGGTVNVARDLPPHPSIVAGLTQPDPVAAFSPPVVPTEPPPHPQGAIPPVPTVAPPPPPPGIEVDAQGVPWDVRIHSGSRAKVQDGTWRQKRNLDPKVFEAVMAELRHTMNVERRAPQPPVPPAPQQVFALTPAVPPIPVVPAAPDSVAALEGALTPGRGLPFPATPEVPPAPFVIAAEPPAPPAAAPITAPIPPSAGAAPSASPSSGPAPTFPQLMQKITAGFHAKTISQADILRAVQAVGLTALPMLAARPDLVPAVATELGVAL